jgi:hypothetical protein
MTKSLVSHEFVFKRTDRLSPREKGQFLALFARVFPKVLSREEFERKYTCTPLGYSYHGLMLAHGDLVGAYNLIPYAYNCFGARRLFGLSVDTMVAPEHRGGPFNLPRMAGLACDGAKHDGVSLAFGFPNDGAYPFTRRVLKWDDIGELDFYALPIRVGAVKPSLKWANLISRLGAGGFLRLPRLGRVPEPDFGVEKVHDKRFEEHRYGREHHALGLGDGGKCVYRTCVETDGVRTTYIIDVNPLTAAGIARAVRAVYAVAPGTDLLLYVGRLPFRPPGLLKVPASRQPRRIRMCGRILDRRLVDDRVLDIERWNVNISNFDVR